MGKAKRKIKRKCEDTEIYECIERDKVRDGRKNAD